MQQIASAMGSGQRLLLQGIAGSQKLEFMFSKLSGYHCKELRLCSQPSATVRNRPHDPRMAVPMVSSAKGSLLDVSHVALLRFAWQTWHFVTFRRVL